VIAFILNLSKNIPNIQLMVGEVSELEKLYVASEVSTKWLISIIIPDKGTHGIGYTQK